MIAHSNSREFLNNMHRSADESVSESRLIEVNKQKEIFIDAGLNVTNAFEDDEMYYLTIQN
jgi:demethylmenaquinone methyltransferase/2-methoxy-6-polyprenyl-1,4-benzoquinol methylase